MKENVIQVKKEYVKTKEAARLLNVTSTTLRRWDKEDKIQTIRTPSGIRMYDKESILSILGIREDVNKTKKICYCRVSTKKQTDDLNRQIDFCRSNYPNHELVTDIGSGINFKRKGIQTILESVMRGEIKELVVSHRDRLSRFGFELFEFIFKCHGAEIIVLDKTENKSSSDELAEDLLSIVHVFSCREMGKRRYKNEKGKTNANSKSDNNSK